MFKKILIALTLFVLLFSSNVYAKDGVYEPNQVLFLEFNIIGDVLTNNDKYSEFAIYNSKNELVKKFNVSYNSYYFSLDLKDETHTLRMLNSNGFIKEFDDMVFTFDYPNSMSVYTLNVFRDVVDLEISFTDDELNGLSNIGFELYNKDFFTDSFSNDEGKIYYTLSNGIYYLNQLSSNEGYEKITELIEINTFECGDVCKIELINFKKKYNKKIILNDSENIGVENKDVCIYYKNGFLQGCYKSDLKGYIFTELNHGEYLFKIDGMEDINVEVINDDDIVINNVLKKQQKINDNELPEEDNNINESDEILSEIEDDKRKNDKEENKLNEEDCVKEDSILKDFDNVDSNILEDIVINDSDNKIYDETIQNNIKEDVMNIIEDILPKNKKTNLSKKKDMNIMVDDQEKEKIYLSNSDDKGLMVYQEKNNKNKTNNNIWLFIIPFLFFVVIIVKKIKNRVKNEQNV